MRGVDLVAVDRSWPRSAICRAFAQPAPADGLSRPGAERALERRHGPARRDHQGRQSRWRGACWSRAPGPTASAAGRPASCTAARAAAERRPRHRLEGAGAALRALPDIWSPPARPRSSSPPRSRARWSASSGRSVARLRRRARRRTERSSDNPNQEPRAGAAVRRIKTSCNGGGEATAGEFPRIASGRSSTRSTHVRRLRTAPDENRNCDEEPAHQSLITDVSRLRLHPCTTTLPSRI